MRHFIARALRGVARRIEPSGPDLQAFLDAKQQELGDVRPLDLGAIIQTCCTLIPEFSFLQIGAHDGSSNDPLMRSLGALNLHGILVEPQAAQFAALQARYGGNSKLKLERAAIAAADGTMPLYKVDPAFWAHHGLLEGIASQISSLDRNQIRRHVELFCGARIAADEAAYLTMETVNTVTLGTLMKRHGLERIDLLQIDAEGFDYEIIKMIDWSEPPRMIHFETIHLAEPDRISAWSLLRERDYDLYATDTHNTLAVAAPRTAAQI